MTQQLWRSQVRADEDHRIDIGPLLRTKRRCTIKPRYRQNVHPWHVFERTARKAQSFKRRPETRVAHITTKRHGI